MRIEIIEKNYSAAAKLKEVIEKKVQKLDKYFDTDTLIKVYLKKESRFFKTEITIDYKGNFIRADVSGDNFYDNIDIILPKVEKQIYKHRTKIEKKLKEGAFKGKHLYDLTAEDIKPGRIVKTKTFDLEPMDIEDAISELDLIGHTFYVFLEKKSKEIRIIYRRDDGDIGFIIPKY